MTIFRHWLSGALLLYSCIGNEQRIDLSDSLPIANQVPFIRSALSAGKHVLSEKPVAENVADAVDLIKWYHENKAANKDVSWNVAENFRYLDSFKYARQEIEKLGKIIGFRVRIYANIQVGWKFFGG